MNKKFSTLMAGLLLAGGAFSNAWATDINTLANTGKYYKIVRTGYKVTNGWTAEKEGEVNTYYLGDAAMVKGSENASLWRVVKDGSSIKLVNFAGETLQVEGKDISFKSEIRYNDVEVLNEAGVETNLLEALSGGYLGNGGETGGSWQLVLSKTASDASSINAWDAVASEASGDVNASWLNYELTPKTEAIRFAYNNGTYDNLNNCYGCVATGVFKVSYDEKTQTYTFTNNSTDEVLIADKVKSFIVSKNSHGAYLQDPTSSKYVKLNFSVPSVTAELVDTPEEATYVGFQSVSDVVVPVEALNVLEKDGFSVTIYYDNKDNCLSDEDHLASDIAGNPFDGHLTTMVWNGSEFKAATSGERFYLKNSDGNYIVAQKYEGQGASVDQALYGFTTVKEADLKHYLIRKADGSWKEGENEYFGNFYAVVDGVDFDADPTAITKIDKLTSLYVEVATNEYAKVGRYDFTTNKVPTLVASKTQWDGGTSLYPVLISLGDREIVDWKEFLQDKFFTIEKVTKDAKDNGYLVPESNADYRFEKTYSNVLEGQWALTVEFSDAEKTKAKTYIFTNRENQDAKQFKLDAKTLYYVSGSENTYKIGGEQYVIKAVNTDPFDGYKVLATDKELNQKWNIAFTSSVFDGKAYLTENHNDANNAAYHVIGLTTDAENALEFSVKKYDGKYEKTENKNVHKYVYTPADTIYVVSTLSYCNAKGKYDTKSDTLKVLAYSFVNQWNEPLAYGDVNANGDEGYKSLVTYKDNNGNTLKYATAGLETAHAGAQKFAIRLDGNNGNYNLRPVTKTYSAYTEGGKPADWKAYQIFNNDDDLVKMYAGDASIGIMDNVDLYDRTENDLFTIEGVDSDIYRRLANNVDTVSIYRNYNEKSLLYEKTTEIADDVFVNFLGMENIADFTKMAPAMIADTAYVRNETYKPQYMLIVDPTIHPAGKWCEEHQSATCEHAVDVPAWTEGRILVNLVDSAKAWDEANKHQVGNPYKNTEGYYKLGFVQATHRNDSLIVNGKRQFIGNNDNHIAKFQFRYADTEDKSFVIETSLDGTQTPGYLKWMNGVVVVVDDIKNADIYNMNEDEHRNPTANENIAAGNVVVAGVNGAVVVKGAEGKNVIVSTILGKVVANEVVSSDNATIAAPAGIVVVSVDGESLKVVVK